MKSKILLGALSFFLLTPVAFASVTYTRTPSESEINMPVILDVSFDTFGVDICPSYPTSDGWALHVATDVSNWIGDNYYASTTLLASESWTLPTGSYYVVSISCFASPADYEAGMDSAYSNSDETLLEGDGSYVIFTTPIPVTYSFVQQLANATSTFQATTGFDIDGVINWGGDNLIKLFIGSGLALLLALRGWLVALVIIGAIVYFAYRAFRFFRH